MTQTISRESHVSQSTAESDSDSEVPNVAAAISSGRSGRFGDRLFAGVSLGAGILILLVLAGVALFLVRDSIPAITATPEELGRENGFVGYVAPLVIGTLVASAIALIVATPVAIGVALYISHYAPRRIAQPVGYVIDLLAAIPSVIFGLWGIQWLMPLIHPVFAWLSTNLGFIPLFSDYQAPARNIMTAGLVLAVMIVPIITATIREVFLQTPRLHEEASLALGATRWEMIRLAVLPFGKSGIVGGAMLGLGRALGETMAVAMILSPALAISFNLLQSGNQTIAAHIALQYPEATGYKVSALIAAGLVLFAITLAVNMGARYVVARGNKESA